MNKMKPEIKAQWVAALRSGKYKQGTGELRSTTDRFCCLGVLCDISGSSGWVREEESCSGMPYGYNSPFQYDLPPPELVRWAGFDWGETPIEIDGNRKTLDEHNDHGRTFAEIADAIEAQL